MGIFDGILLCSDIDGTLVNRERGITPAVRDAIGYFQQNGGRFTVSTGRMPEYIRRYGIEPNAPVVSMNGTAVVDITTGQLLFGHPMTDAVPDVRAMLAQANGLERVFLSSLRDSAEWDPASGEPLCPPPGTEHELYKVLFRFVREEDALAFRDAMRTQYEGRYRFDRSWAVGVEMYHTDGGKGDSVCRLKRELTPPVTLLVTAGDYENDLTMLRQADVSFATANAVELAKAAATRLAPSCDEDAIAWIIHTLETEYAGR